MAQCIGKMVYRDLAIATRVAKSYTESNYQKRTFRPYVCNICSGVHLTSKALRGRR